MTQTSALQWFQAKQRGESPMVACDLCELPMAWPDHLKPGEPVLGLLVCCACIADELEARCEHVS